MNSPFQHVKSLGQLRPPCWILCFHCSTNAHQGPKIVTIPHNNSETPAFVVFLSSIWIFLREWISNEIIWKQALCYHGSNDRILFSRQKVTIVVVARSGLSAKMLFNAKGRCNDKSNSYIYVTITIDRMFLLSLTAPDSNLGAVYLSSFRFRVKLVDNAVRFPVLRSRQFWWFHILSHSQCRPFSWVGADNILHLTFQRGGGRGAYIEKTTLTELMVKSTQQQPVFPSSI